MSNFPIVAEYPAYKLVRKSNYTFRDGDKIAIPYQSQRHGTLYHFYRFGSVAGYAVQNGECPEAALKQARERGHEIHWASQCATIITAQAQPQEVAAYVEIGDIVRAFGRYFGIAKAPNDNIALVEIAMTREEWLDRVVEDVAKYKK